MKNIILILLLLILSSVNAQKTTKKYNSLQERYEYFDQNGNMIGYEKYNSLMEQWEYFSTSRSQSKSGYSNPQSNFDPELAMKVLQAKQRRYDALSQTEKMQLAANREYKRKKRYVYKMTKKPAKKLDKNIVKQQKKAERNYNKFKRKKKLNINNLDSGWYECYFLWNDLGYLKRKLLINDGNIVQYFNGRHLVQIRDYKKEVRRNVYELKASLYGIKFNFSVFIIDDTNIKKPDIKKPTKLLFYTKSDNINGSISVILRRKNKGIFKSDDYLNGGVIDHYIYESPHCNQKKYIRNVVLTPGKYKYYAFSDTEFWTDEVILKPYDCRKINLINN